MNQNINNTESGYRINNLLLLESNFKRAYNVQFDTQKVQNKSNINVEVGVQGKVINVVETVDYKQFYDNQEQVSINVKMVGVFECIGPNEIENFETFGKINGAAMIFPYIREYITNISLKAGIGPIFLPPVNFSNNK